ncbi:MAG TPA: family 43 glycosylhydrolase, partial [Bacillota bacterium]|nr:family 43 glycosylhydrolase [Bacillota bacterium]
YGLPVDNRTDTSLIDWALWSIAPARNEAAFQALLEPIWRYANETPARVPLSDWFVTTSAAQKGFQARPVVGGIFIKLLADGTTWRNWARRGADTRGPWAAIPVGGATTVVVPTAQTVPAKWRYTLESPAEDWMKPRFEDHAWQEGQGGFGTKGTPGAIIGTEWKTANIWLRREFTLPERPLKDPRLLVNYDEDPEIYLNGVLAARLTGWNGQYDEVDIAPAALATLKPGRNVLAVRARQTYGGQSIDVGIVAEGAGSGQTPAAGREPASSKLPGLRKLMDTPLRDTSICRGPDGNWYLTGTVEPFWAYNQGIQVWKSPDLTNWTALGFVWKYGGSPWHQPYLEKKKPLWAPEIHYLKGTFWLTYSLPGWNSTGKTSGCGLLRSTSGKAEGPYQDMHPQGRLGDEIDASLFQDDDGAIYFLWHSGKIARMKPDLSDLAESYRWLRTTTTDPNPKHHSGLCAGIFGKDSFDHVGYEGMFIFKREGRYYLACAENFEGRYSCSVATATNLFGPYGERYEAIPHGGHNTFFRDAAGHWWSTFFGSDPQAPWRERPGVLPVEFSPQGRLQPLQADSARTFYVDAERGEDQQDGLKPETAWRSLAQVNHAPLAPGDRVLFRRGQTWRGQLVAQSGNASGVITYGAFGKGLKPVLLGSVAA